MPETTDEWKFEVVPKLQRSLPESPFGTLRTDPPVAGDRLWDRYVRAINDGEAFPRGEELRGILADAAVWCDYVDNNPFLDDRFRPHVGGVDAYVEIIFRLQFAFDSTRGSLWSFRESGLVSEVQLMADGCCPVCEALEPIFPLTSDIIIPIPGCTNPEGCSCAIAPVVNLGEDD